MYSGGAASQLEAQPSQVVSSQYAATWALCILWVRLVLAS